jgi:hypothetical protein
MKSFVSGLFGQAVKSAAVGAALMLSMSASHAQSSSPFAGFDGAWAGTGTVSLSDGTTERISGNWSEASRNIFGNLQGTAGGGQINVFVEANGFSANLTLRTNGNKQTVQISSKGEIRGVNITMVKS